MEDVSTGRVGTKIMLGDAEFEDVSMAFYGGAVLEGTFVYLLENNDSPPTYRWYGIEVKVKRHRPLIVMLLAIF